LLEQLGQPLPAIGRLERKLGLLAEPAEQLAEALTIVDQPAREQLSAVLIHDGNV
jgi:hypothetical protein